MNKCFIIQFPQKVKCISEDIGIKKDFQYLLDLASVWMDNDGDSYGTIYSLTEEHIGQKKLSHFTSFTW